MANLGDGIKWSLRAFAAAAPRARALSLAARALFTYLYSEHASTRDDAKRTETNMFGREDRGFSSEDQQDKKANNNDEFYFKRMPTNYGYKDMMKDLFA
ncbi:hypothetical protein ACROYT_G023838 [Oculina patagonica]